MSISEGGTFTVKGGRFVVLHPAADGGGVGVYFGPVRETDDNTYVGTGLLVQDEAGLDIFTARTDEASGNAVCVMWDGDHSAAVFTDSSGVGLGRPYVPFHFYSARFTDTPQVTSSASFESLWLAYTYKTNPKMYVAASAGADVGTAGEVRVLVNGVALGSTGVVSSTPAAFTFGPSTIAGAVGDQVMVQIQARVTSGAGSIRVAPQVGTGFPS
jgi:hypothetical protein